MRRTVAAVFAILFAACGGDSDAGRQSATSTTSTSQGTSSSTSTSTSTTSDGDAAPLDITAVQYVGLFNAQLPLSVPDGTDFELSPVAEGVYGSTVDLGTTVLVFAETPTSPVTAVSVVVDVEITGGTIPAKLVFGASFGLEKDDPSGVGEAFNSKVVPDLASITSARTDYDLGPLDLILTAEDQSVTFTYVATGGELPAFLGS